MAILSELLNEVNIVTRAGDLDIQIAGVTDDSREVRDGYVFVCMPAGYESPNARWEWMPRAGHRLPRRRAVECPLRNVRRVPSGSLRGSKVARLPISRARHLAAPPTEAHAATADTAATRKTSLCSQSTDRRMASQDRLSGTTTACGGGGRRSPCRSGRLEARMAPGPPHRAVPGWSESPDPDGWLSSPCFVFSPLLREVRLAETPGQRGHLRSVRLPRNKYVARRALDRVWMRHVHQLEPQKPADSLQEDQKRFWWWRMMKTFEIW